MTEITWLIFGVTAALSFCIGMAIGRKYERDNGWKEPHYDDN